MSGEVLGENDDADAIDGAIRARLFDVLTTLPARVESYDRATQTVDAQPLPASFQGADVVPFPILRGVPVAFPRAGGASITWPIAVGDFVLLHFASRAIERWLADGTEGDPQSRRAQHLSDAVAVPGVWPSGDRLADVPVADLEMRPPTGGKLLLGKGATSPAAKGDTMRNEINVLWAAIKVHEHPVAGAIAGPSATLAALAEVSTAVLAADVRVK